MGKTIFFDGFLRECEPGRDVTPAWLVQQQEKKKSGWEILADKKGRVTHRQLIPPSLENDRFFNESSRSSWVLEIIESCYVAGVGAIAGTSESVIFSNYHSMIKKKEASKLWEIHPEGNETPLK